jgi:hypothetical protein
MLMKSWRRFWKPNRRPALAANCLDKPARFFRNSQGMKTSIPPILITFALVCFALVQNTQAVSPPPDGAYPGGNTAEGDSALFSLTTGVYDTALGFVALYHNTIGSDNTAVGGRALEFNTTGGTNTAIGVAALYQNTTGGGNTATGAHALFSNFTASNNTADGFNALASNVFGTQNTATGAFALYRNATGNRNTADGFQALLNNITGEQNTATGLSALKSNTANNNTAVGYQVALDNTTGADNTAIGHHALSNNTTGSSNIALGKSAGVNLTTGSNNIDIGSAGGVGESDTIRIGSVQTRTFIKGISGGVVTGTAVVVNAASELGVAPSSSRYKDKIAAIDKTSEAILALKPVTFYYKKEIDPEGIPQFGLVAEDVEKVNRDLVVRDAAGKPYTVRYDAVNAMLLNEFLKEHGKVQELEATVANQQKQIEALTAGLQKVSAQLELNKPSPQTVVNNQ